MHQIGLYILLTEKTLGTHYWWSLDLHRAVRKKIKRIKYDSISDSITKYSEMKIDDDWTLLQGSSQVCSKGVDKSDTRLCAGCSVLQCVAVCCSVLQCVAVCCSVYKNLIQDYVQVAVCCSVLPCVAVCCSVLQCVAVCERFWYKTTCRLQCVAVCCSVSQCVAVCSKFVAVFSSMSLSSGVLQCVAVCCSVLWCVAVCSSV